MHYSAWLTLGSWLSVFLYMLIGAIFQFLVKWALGRKLLLAFPGFFSYGLFSKQGGWTLMYKYLSNLCPRLYVINSAIAIRACRSYAGTDRQVLLHQDVHRAGLLKRQGKRFASDWPIDQHSSSPLSKAFIDAGSPSDPDEKPDQQVTCRITAPEPGYKVKSPTCVL